MATKITGSKSLKEAAKEYLALKEQMDEIAAKMDNLKKEIQDYMGASEEAVIDEVTIRWTSFVTTRFDQSAFKALHPKLYENFKTSSESRRFGITEDKHYQGGLV